jgi:hypothetical protein
MAPHSLNQEKQRKLERSLALNRLQPRARKPILLGASRFHGDF